MNINYSAFILPHIGDSFNQCADRFSYSEANNCFAIADGVGNSLFPGEWATIVCDDYVAHPMNFMFESHLVREKELIDQWEKQRDEQVANLTDNERFIYEMGLDKADFAACTFVGLSLQMDKWKCQAIGDSYLFAVDNNYNIVRKVASMVGHDFGYFPEYLASKDGKNNGQVVEVDGMYKGISFLVLMTDALSDWFIATSPKEREKLLHVLTHKEFEGFVDKKRQEGALKDDDTTLLILKLEDDGKKEISFHRDNVDNIEVLKLSDKVEQPNGTGAFSTSETKRLSIVKEKGQKQIPVDRIEKIKNEFKTYKLEKLQHSVEFLLKYIKTYLNNGTTN